MQLTYDDLKSCHALVREANDMMERIARLESLAERTTSPITPNSIGYGGGISDKVGNSASALADMRTAAQERADAYFGHAQQVELAINALPDSLQRTILRKRYLDGMRWEEIAMDVHYSERHCKRVHKGGMIALGVWTEDVL